MRSKPKKDLTDPILKEAHRLYTLGLGIHWLKENSKAPVKNGWSGPKRDGLKTLLAEYSKGYGLGIRLGAPSELEDGFLAVIDMDIRSPDPRYLKEAIAVVDRFQAGLRESAPCVLTGRGFGSAHFYFVTSEPLASINLGRSSETVKVYSPSSGVSGEQERFVEAGKLTKMELKKGFRMKAAWEIDHMSAGKQVVVPPTRHPDTNERYRWSPGRGLE